MSPFKMLGIGASAGGIQAVQRLLSFLPDHFKLPIAIVQHLPSDAHIEPAFVFGAATRLVLQEARDKTPIQSGHVYFAPPGYHLLIEKDRTFALSQEEPVLFARPSINIFFESLALIYGESACGVLLTGANSDGAMGLKALRDSGGTTVVQNPDDAEATAMPRAALSLFQPDFMGDIPDIARFLVRHLETNDDK